MRNLLNVAPLLLVALAAGAQPDRPSSEPALVCEAAAGARCWYVAADAPAGGDGSAERPFRMPQDAVDRAAPGDFVYLRGGAEFTHEHAARDRTLFGPHPRCCTDGRPDALITVKSYPGEQAVSRGTMEPRGNLGIAISRSGWRVEGLRVIHGTICVACQFAKGIENVWVVANHVSDAVAAAGNFGLITISGDQRPDPGHPRDIHILGNTVHTLWDGRDGYPPRAWPDDPDVEHHACIMLQHASGAVEIADNELYECASIFYFKYDGPGPVDVARNRLHRAQTLGQLRSSRNTFRENVVWDVPRGFWVRSRSHENVVRNNTLVGLDAFAGFEAIATQTFEGNVVFGGGWISGSGDYAAAKSEGNCFIGPANFRAYVATTTAGGPQGRTPAERTRTPRPATTDRTGTAARGTRAQPAAREPGADAQRRRESYTLEQVRSAFGQERTSLRLTETNAASVFRDPDKGDFALVGRAAVECEGRGAYAE